MILRQGNVGPIVRGTQSGDLLVYDATVFKA